MPRPHNMVESHEEDEAHESSITPAQDEVRDAVDAVGELVHGKTEETVTPSTKCHLLALPGEMQNQIYREVRLDRNHISVTRSGYDRSSFFATCKQIRKAVASFYYLENTFKFRSLDMDPTPMLFFDRSFAQLGLGNAAKWQAMVVAQGRLPYWIEGDGLSKAARSPDKVFWAGLNISLPLRWKPRNKGRK